MSEEAITQKKIVEIFISVPEKPNTVYNVLIHSMTFPIDTLMSNEQCIAETLQSYENPSVPLHNYNVKVGTTDYKEFKLAWKEE